MSNNARINAGIKKMLGAVTIWNPKTSWSNNVRRLAFDIYGVSIETIIPAPLKLILSNIATYYGLLAEPETDQSRGLLYNLRLMLQLIGKNFRDEAVILADQISILKQFYDQYGNLVHSEPLSINTVFNSLREIRNIVFIIIYRLERYTPEKKKQIKKQITENFTNTNTTSTDSANYRHFVYDIRNTHVDLSQNSENNFILNNNANARPLTNENLEQMYPGPGFQRTSRRKTRKHKRA